MVRQTTPSKVCTQTSPNLLHIPLEQEVLFPPSDLRLTVSPWSDFLDQAIPNPYYIFSGDVKKPLSVSHAATRLQMYDYCPQDQQSNHFGGYNGHPS